MANQPPLLTVPEVAAYLNLHPQTIRRWIKAGTLQAKRINGSVRIDPADIKALVG